MTDQWLDFLRVKHFNALDLLNLWIYGICVGFLLYLWLLTPRRKR